MRLTLRTLLAYLDDILPPAETKELGEKIAASPVASQLVERIREVMRRRRLTAPETDGSGGGIEPNLVAEYLDNSLPPDRVADVERVCLESDVNLAEVAACHQVLTLVLGEPVDIPGRLRERMYALGPQGTPLEVPEAVAPKTVRETNGREQFAAIQAAQKSKPASARVPDYLKSKPLWRRALPWMIAPLLLLAYLGLFWYDPTFFPGGDRAKEDKAVANADERDRPAVAAGEPREDQPEGDAIAAVAVPPAETEVLDLPVDPDPPADEVPVTGEPVVESPPDQGESAPAAEATSSAVAETTAEPAAPTTEPAEAAEPAAAPVADAAAPPLDIISTDGIVLRFDAASGQWFPVPTGQDPPAGAAVAVADPFRAEMKVANLPLRLLALGGTRLTPFGQTEAAPVGFDVAQGRLRIAGDSAAAGDATKMMFALQIGQGLWRVEPLTPETVIGVEATPLQPYAEGQDLTGRTPQGVLYVGAGTVRVADASGRVEVASAGNRLILAASGGGDGLAPVEPAEPAGDSAEVTDEVAAEPLVDAEGEPAPAEATGEAPAADEPAGDAPAEAATGDAPAAVDPIAPFAMPDWVVAPRDPTSAARRVMAGFKAEFVPDAPATASLRPAVKNRNFNVAEPAAKALGLIEDVDGLVTTLRDAEHEEAILAAVDGLRNWLGRAPANGDILRDRLGQTFNREGMADTLYKLLWGYGPEDARDATTAGQLVDWLAHPEPVVRELAFYHVKRLSGRTLNYNPLATQNQRAGSVNQWRAFVNRHGGLVIGD